MSNSMYREAGKRIMQLRLDRRYTREQLAELASISSKFLYEIEVGEKGFSAYTLVNLARSLGVNCDYILSGQGNKQYDEHLAYTIKLSEIGKLEKVNTILKAAYELINDL